MRKHAREARFELLRKSVLEESRAVSFEPPAKPRKPTRSQDIALPFGGPPREAKNAAKKLSAARLS